MPKTKIFLYSAILVAATAALWGVTATPGAPSPSAERVAPPLPETSSTASTAALVAGLKEILKAYRQIIVLVADEPADGIRAEGPAVQLGRILFHHNLERQDGVGAALTTLLQSRDPGRYDTVSGLLQYVEADPELYDADRLAFTEVLADLRTALAKDQTLPAIKLRKRVEDDLEAIAEIEKNYEAEVAKIFGRFNQRAIVLKRERWDAYVVHLRELYSREELLNARVRVPTTLGQSQQEAGTQPAVDPAKEPAAEPPAEISDALRGGPATRPEKGEIFGYSLPPKTVLLTFDDGPHQAYTREIASILQQYGAPAVFFEVGRNIGKVSASGAVALSAGAKISRALAADGYLLGNHSYTHALLSKLTGDPLAKEIDQTDTLLKAAVPTRSNLFRFPYGAHSKEGLQALRDRKLRSMMWNVDSLDWADPVPGSIVNRVMQGLKKEGRGVLLFHDIHGRTVKALPQILSRLVAEGYSFATWDGQALRTTQTAVAAATRATDAVATGRQPGDSWAVLIGVDDYAKWPKLEYAVRDTAALRDLLVRKFGFQPDKVFMLNNSEATRDGVAAVFNDKLMGGEMRREDRVLVFFAGHGATRKLSSGRDLGYIIPANSDPSRFSVDAIPMTDLQNLAEGLVSRHVLFIMDSCYSGLGLTRGGSDRFLSDNATRISRQMLTAGGQDQMVADGGPNGHSIFTWTLLQALEGKGDLNGDGLITGTELAAYVAPAVAAVSAQTPAFGNLPGSEGGEFVFERAPSDDLIGSDTPQLPIEAITLAAKQAASTTGPLSAAPAEVSVKDLQGGSKVLRPEVAQGPVTPLQLALASNDKGLQLYAEKQYPAAVAAFVEALRLQPRMAKAANNLGFVHFKQGNYLEAQKWISAALELDPTRAVAYLNLGDVFVAEGAKAEATKAYRAYLKLVPTGAGAARAKRALEAGHREGTEVTPQRAYR